jgi:3-isopropylmalate/(R)-2-methylmalate dehydratase small subunit
MQAFTTITAIAVGVPIANIDTDMLFPADFLKTTSREGLRNALFAALRADPEFHLNFAPWDRAGILVALDNFGCGSSREHAPWALLDFGIRCVIAPSFADIFHANCLKNGILPIRLCRAEVAALLEDASTANTAVMTVDLERQSILRSGGENISFSIDPQQRERLLHGLDDISLSLTHAAGIEKYEATAASTQPWLKPIPNLLP